MNADTTLPAAPRIPAGIVALCITARFQRLESSRPRTLKVTPEQ
jgi:hypothetical protein